MSIETIKSACFVGAGDVGVSALVRYFLSKGKVIAEYNRTPTPSTENLIAKDAQVRHEENVRLTPKACRDKRSALVVLTPAVPQEHEELVCFHNNGFEIQKCAQILGTVIHSSRDSCVAGTHGETTTSTVTVRLLHQPYIKYTALLGGIFKNYGINLLFSQKNPYIVIEADEFDRSFHWLSPYMSVITATDPDRLDIYRTEKAYLKSFKHYTTLIQPGGASIIQRGISLQPKVQVGVRVYTYSHDERDFHAGNIRIGNGEIFIDFVTPNTRINNIQLGVPISINIENGIATMVLVYLSGVTDEGIRQGMNSFHGVDRRFDFKVRNDQVAFLNGYVHHPSRIKQSVLSICEPYKDKKITAILQPHLYTRTHDFYQDFADSLSLLDEVILVDIYPVRETLIPGVTSKLMYNSLRSGTEKSMCRKEEVLNVLKGKNIEVLITLGAEDVDNYAFEIKEELEKMKDEERRTKN